MFEISVHQFAPQLSKLISYLLIFILGMTILNVNGGIPRQNNRIISKRKTLSIIIVLGGFYLFVFEPFMENVILLLLSKYIKFALPVSFLVGGIAILKFDEKMRGDYSTYGNACIFIGIIWSFFVVLS